VNRAAFFTAIRSAPFAGSLTAEQVQGLEAKLDAFEEARWPLAWAAYGLATSFWETARTMQPVREIGKGRGRRYGVPAGPHGHVYYGRGDVQLTWLENYERAGAALGIDLVKRPDLALEPNTSARIMVRGMQEGWFAGDKKGRHTTARWLDGPRPDYVGARRIINGTDKAALIADIARAFEKALRAGGYDGVPDAVAKPPAAIPAPPPPDIPKPETPASAPRIGFWGRFVRALRGR
jgi:putative chitinase